MTVESARLARIVGLVDRVSGDVRESDRSTFEGDRLLIDATAFRVMHIGELAKGLDHTVRRRHEALPWREMKAMRNLLAHDYDAIDPAILWRAVHDHLDELKTACLAELAADQIQGE